MSMSRWRYVMRIILGILTAIFIGVGLDLREEIPEMGWSFIVAGAVCFIVVIILLLKSTKKYGIAELVSDMENISTNLADFAGERERGGPIHRIKMNKPNWDDARKQEEWEERTRELMDYGSETASIYRRRFGRKVVYLVEEARKFGYEDREIDSLYKRPTNRLGIEMLSDRMGALALRMKKDVK